MNPPQCAGNESRKLVATLFRLQIGAQHHLHIVPSTTRHTKTQYNSTLRGLQACIKRRERTGVDSDDAVFTHHALALSRSIQLFPKSGNTHARYSSSCKNFRVAVLSSFSFTPPPARGWWSGAPVERLSAHTIHTHTHTHTHRSIQQCHGCKEFEDGADAEPDW